jgi:hypothetical protein
MVQYDNKMLLIMNCELVNHMQGVTFLKIFFVVRSRVSSVSYSVVVKKVVFDFRQEQGKFSLRRHETHPTYPLTVVLNMWSIPFIVIITNYLINCFNDFVSIFAITTFERRWEFIILFVVLDRLDGPGFDSRQRQETFSSPKLARPALGPTQPAIQWVQGFYARVKVTGA